MMPPMPLPFAAPNLRGLLRRASALAALVTLAAGVASCSLSRPAPVKQVYLLEPSAPAAAAAPRPVAVRVGAVNVAAPFRGRAFIYRDGELRYEANYYDEFLVAPGAMISEATAKALAAAGVFRRVVPPGATADDGDYLLEGFVSELYADVSDPAKPAAVLAVTFYLSPTGAPVPSFVWSREYRQRAAYAGAGSDALARAWNAALTAILADLARDLAAAPLPTK